MMTTIINSISEKPVARSYELLVALLTGNPEVIKDIQLRFHFINAELAAAREAVTND